MKIKNLLFPAFALFMVSCKKNSQTTTPSQQDAYLTTSSGSTWQYHQVDSSGSTPVIADYTLTSSARDTMINGKNYHIYDNSTGSLQYLNLTGNDYFQFDSLPSGLGVSAFEQLYLKDNSPAGTTWSQSLSVTVPGIPFPVPVTLTYKIAEKGIVRTVNAKNYSNVIHVSTTLSSSLIPAASLTSSIDSYYAEKYGLIENTTIINLDYSGIVVYVNIGTKIVTATLK